MSIFQLRQYIRSVLVEGAISSAQAAEQGLALCIEMQDSDSADYVLYDPDKLEELVELNKNPWNDEVYTSCIIGMIGIITDHDDGSGWNASIVTAAAAERGYGPLLYDIVMSQEDGLMADRSTVRPAAKKVWQYYKDQRPDVIAKPLDNKFAPKTEPRIDDVKVYPDGVENPLNYAYFATRHPDITGLRKNHADVMEKLVKYNFNVIDLIDAASHYFGSRYQNG